MDNLAHKDISRRLERAWDELRNCMLCPRGCGVDRTQGQKGFCGISTQSYCFREMIHNSEEDGLNPSHQVYFSGCNLRCRFCSVGEWNREPVEPECELDPQVLAAVILKRHAEGAKTLNLLGGEPTVNLHGILTVLQQLSPEIQVIWNSNMYYNLVIDELMDGLIDIFLADLKCGNDLCAGKLLGAKNYVATVKENIARAAAKKPTIVRHVLIPGHFECCAEPVLEWLSERNGDVSVSIKGDYIPPADDDMCPEGYTSEAELSRAIGLSEKLGLKLVN